LASSARFGTGRRRGRRSDCTCRDRRRLLLQNAGVDYCL
ncbi:hypothetical protein T03_7669, partial [Trichinella britovi]